MKVFNNISEIWEDLDGPEAFDIVVGARCCKIKEVLASKAKEYATERSRFHNFEVAARILDTTPEKALMGMLIKHFVSVMDLVEAPESATEDMINEKIGDSVNYLILLEGMLRQRISA